jgi:hypothetical protein
VIGHLGPRVSALLDGQLCSDEEERAWEHVHACHLCRDLVEREGWVKTRLAELGVGLGDTPSGLKGSLMLAPAMLPPGGSYLMASARSRPRAAAVAVGSGAVGVAMLGVLLVGAAPASAPTDRRAPVTSVVGSGSTPSPIPAVVEGPGQDRTRRQASTVSVRR